MKRTTFFKPSGSTSPEPTRTAHQTIRGRISAPIPFPDPLAPPSPAAQVLHHETAILEEEPPSSKDTSPAEAHATPQDTDTEEIAKPNAELIDSKEPGGEDSLEPKNEPTAISDEAESSETMPPLQSPKMRQAASSSVGHQRAQTIDQPVPQLQQPLQHQQRGQPPNSAQTIQLDPNSSTAGDRPGAGAGTSGSGGGSRSASGSGNITESAGNSSASPAFRHRTNPSSTLRFSAVSGVSGGGGTSGANTLDGSLKPQRKKSTLRGALSKLFGRKKKTESQIIQPATIPEMVPQHRSVRSDPTVLSRPRDGESKRSASLPITEYDRALRSHSIGPDDIVAIGSARNSFQADGASASLDASSRRRAAMSTNRNLYPQQGRRRFGNNSVEVLSGSEWTGLSPRPASVHGRGAHSRMSGHAIGGGSSGAGGNGDHLGPGMFSDDRTGHGSAATDPDQIGRAITSDISGATDVSQRRRSRSLSGLNDLAFDQNQSRRRSDEIRYWRESYNPGFLSPLSSGPDIDIDGDDDVHSQIYDDDGRGARSELKNALTDKEKDIVFHGGDNEDDFTGAVSLLQSLPDSPETPSFPAGQQAEEQRQQLRERPRTPPQPFSFGNLSSFGTPSANMKITQANTMDSRLGGLETRMHRIEQVVDQLCHSVPSYTAAPAPTTGRSDQVPRSVPPFPGQMNSSPYAPSSSYSPGGLPAIPPIPAIYQTRTTNAPHLSSSAAGDGDGSHGYHPYNPYTTPNNASISRYSSSQHSAYSAHSGQSFDSDMHSHMSFGDGQTYIGSLRPPSSSATQTQSILSTSGGPGSSLSPSNQEPTLRPTSTSTVRGAMSLPALGVAASNDSTADLMAQLETERAVRQTLETQVKKLNERVNALSTTMYAMLRDPTAPKSRSSREPLASPSFSNLREQSSSAAAVAAAAKTTATQLKVESVLQTAKALGHGVSIDTETDSEGDFLTPTEDLRGPDRKGHYNEYNEYNNYNYTDDNDNDTSGSNDGGNRRKKAARTLSLGQLTLNKSAVPTSPVA